MYSQTYQKLKQYIERYPEKKENLITLTQKELEDATMEEGETNGDSSLCHQGLSRGGSIIMRRLI